jgi:hypothetical protein
MNLNNYETELSRYLRGKGEIKDNPFLDSFFFVLGEETLGDACSCHLVKEIEVIFIENRQVFKFKKKDSVLALYVIILTINNPFSHDDDLKLKINEKLLKKVEKEEIALFEILYKSVGEYNTVDLIFSNNEFGVNAFKTNEQMLWYVIDGAHDDDYFYNLEKKRRDGLL